MAMRPKREPKFHDLFRLEASTKDIEGDLQKIMEGLSRARRPRGGRSAFSRTGGQNSTSHVRSVTTRKYAVPISAGQKRQMSEPVVSGEDEELMMPRTKLAKVSEGKSGIAQKTFNKPLNVKIFRTSVVQQVAASGGEMPPTQPVQIASNKQMTQIAPFPRQQKLKSEEGEWLMQV